MNEPTIGLDPVVAQQLRLLITHYIYEVDQLCDRIGLINHGDHVDFGSPT